MKNERPILITIMCILGFIGVSFQILGSIFTLIPGVSAILGQLVPVWYSILSIFFAVAYLIGFIFIWKMKKWALIFYTLIVIISYGVLFLMGVGSFFGLISSVIFVSLLWTQFKKMS